MTTTSTESGGEPEHKIFTVTATLTYDYDSHDGLVTTTTEAEADMWETLSGANPNAFTITVTESINERVDLPAPLNTEDPEIIEALDQLVHDTASQVATNVNNEQRWEDYLLAHGWTLEQIRQAVQGGRD